MRWNKERMPASLTFLIQASTTCQHQERRHGRWNKQSRRRNGRLSTTCSRRIPQELWLTYCQRRTRRWSNHVNQVSTWSKNQTRNCRTRAHQGKSYVPPKHRHRSHQVSCLRSYLIWSHSATTQRSSRCPVPTLWAVRETPVAPLLDYHRWCSTHQRRMPMSPSRRRSQQRITQQW